MYLPFRGTSATAWGDSYRTGLESWTEGAPTSFNSWTELALNHRQLRFSDVNSCTAAIIGKEHDTMKKQIVIGFRAIARRAFIYEVLEAKLLEPLVLGVIAE